MAASIPPLLVSCLFGALRILTMISWAERTQSCRASPKCVQMLGDFSDSLILGSGFAGHKGMDEGIAV